jgi:hypothetical protein
VPPRSAIDAVSPAIQHARRQLIPLRWRTWVRLAALGLATGELGSAGGCNVPGGFHVPSTAGGARTDHFLATLPKIPPHLGLGPAQFVAVVATLILLLVLLGLVGVYVASVSRFVLFESVLTGHYDLRQSWRRWQAQGTRLFLFNLVLGIVSMTLLVLLIGVPVLLAVMHGVWRRGQSLGPLLAYLVLMIMALGAFALVFVLVHVLTKDFVVPQMAFENLGPWAGWRRLLTMMDRERGGYAGYLGMKIVLAMGSALLFGIMAFLVLLMFMVPVIVVVVIGIVAVPGHGAWMWNPFTLTAALIIGCTLLTMLMFVIALVYAPATAFFTAYPMHFFAARYPALAAVLYPPPAAPLLAPPPAG